MAELTATLADEAVLSQTGRDRWRRFVDRAWTVICVLATLAVLIPLVAIIGFVAVRGIQAISVEFLTSVPVGVAGGGAEAAILGTLQMVPLATLIAAPIGVLGGLYLHEHGGGRVGIAIRFCADVTVGVPSVVIGIFVFTFLVAPFGRYNAFAGSIALAVIMIPIILRSTEEVLGLVPGTIREASLALGIPMWRTAVSVILRTGLAGILTGIMLAVARAAGETAPLIFTALGSRLLNVGDWGKPMDALPLYVYANSGTPDPTAVENAWGAAFLLLVFVLVVNVLVRFRTVGRRIQ